MGVKMTFADAMDAYEAGEADNHSLAEAALSVADTVADADRFLDFAGMRLTGRVDTWTMDGEEAAERAFEANAAEYNDDDDDYEGADE